MYIEQYSKVVLFLTESRKLYMVVVVCHLGIYFVNIPVRMPVIKLWGMFVSVLS